MKIADDRLLRNRFERLGGPDDRDWNDVRRRARWSPRRTVVLIAALAVALVATGFGLGGHVLGLFADHGKSIPISSLTPRDRELIVNSLCRHLAFSSTRDKPPREICRDGDPTIEEIANDGKRFYWSVRYPYGFRCIATGSVQGHRDPNRGTQLVDSFGCNVGAANEKLVPSPKRPITYDEVIGQDRGETHLRIRRVTGLAGQGVASVGLVARDGSVAKARVREREYTIASIPDRRWVAIAAFDASGHKVYSKPLNLPRPFVVPNPTGGRVMFPKPPKRPHGTPLQHSSSSAASVDVYRNSVIVLRFASTESDAYRRLARSARHSSGGVGISCSTVAFGAGSWKDLGGGWSVHLAPELRMRMETRYGGVPSPPFDFCEVSGTYGRYWNDEEGTHDLVELPFTAIARRYLDERATARDLAYFVRTRKMWRIRKAVHRGERAPSAVEIAQRFGPRVVPLARLGASAPDGKIGVWSDGKLIVVSERTPAGRRLFVTVNGVLIGTNNIHDLSFTF